MIIGIWLRKRLNRQKKPLPLVARQRSIIGHGDESICLSDGHKKVLLITQAKSAEKIELFKQKLRPEDKNRSDFKIAVPTKVAVDQDVHALVNPDKPNLAKELFLMACPVLYKHVKTKNVVYSHDRFDGTLEEAASLRFKEKSIDILKDMLEANLKILHDNNMTHRDIHCRNIFYKGEFPNLSFYLGDVASIEQSPDGKHRERVETDLSQVAALINKMKSILHEKYEKKKGYQSQAELSKPSGVYLPSIVNKSLAKMGVSPVKTRSEQTEHLKITKAKSRFDLQL